MKTKVIRSEVTGKRLRLLSKLFEDTVSDPHSTQASFLRRLQKAHQK